MDRPEFLTQYLFDWELFQVVMGGKSILDSPTFLSPLPSHEDVDKFLTGYGYRLDDPIHNAELFGNFQEALQFIRRYFLKEGNPDGLELAIPNELYTIQDVRELFQIATGTAPGFNKEISLWAGVICKVMHTILHADKDLRSNYFPIIQTQVFDKFYKHLNRDKYDNLFLGTGKKKIPLVDFEIKSKKSRESVIIKMLHKVDNVAEELFDRIGMRIIAKNRFDCLRVIKYLVEKNVVIPHNIQTNRSLNTTIDTEKFRMKQHSVIKLLLRNELNEERFYQALVRAADDCPVDDNEKARNLHSSEKYHAIHFTCRQLIKYENPFFHSFSQIRNMAKDMEEKTELANKILELETGTISRDIRFFYPYEVQVVSEADHEQNTKGEASHVEYKKSQLKAAMNRIFSSLIKLQNEKIQS